MQTYSPRASVKHFLGMYRAEAQKSGYTASNSQLGWMAPVYVAATDEQAREEARAHIESFINKFLLMPSEFVRPPGYMTLSSYKAVMAAKSEQTRKRSMETVIENGSFICGSVETVREQVLAAAEELGLGYFLALLHFGTLPHDLTMRNIELFATQVMPYVRERLAEKVRA